MLGTTHSAAVSHPRTHESSSFPQLLKHNTTHRCLTYSNTGCRHNGLLSLIYLKSNTTTSSFCCRSWGSVCVGGTSFWKASKLSVRFRSCHFSKALWKYVSHSSQSFSYLCPTLWKTSTSIFAILSEKGWNWNHK